MKKLFLGFVCSATLLSGGVLGTESAKADVIDGYWTTWEVQSKEKAGLEYGPWVRVGEARGKSGGASLTISDSRSVSNTYSGNLKIPIRDLEGTLGFTFGNTFTRTATYNISVTDPNKVYYVDSRNIYQKYNVKQKSEYKVMREVIKTDTQTVVAKEFTAFGYNWGVK
ncbi:hypothetical protein [Bacillus cereus]|uniref:hypothetical protein n=1 Tax=Bacillus cereus TaxID=1396 RepID=UPI0018F7C796|nr:hypothetical protein [Bacillus cereus]MBJ7967900.1 hypothetical protein [Bacillus cereus]MBJ8004297.1 hypothetical protein [Bacillus cereus]